MQNRASHSPENVAPPVSCRLLVAGEHLHLLAAGEQGFGNYATIAGAFADLSSLLAAPDLPVADLLLVAAPAVFPETVAAVREARDRCGASRAVLVYEFAKASTEADFAREGCDITALRAPVTASDLRAACEADLALAAIRAGWVPETQSSASAPEPDEGPSPEIPKRRFSDGELARAAQVSTAIDCECPHHLAALLMSLNAFEAYSRECESRNDEDALLHVYLHRATARARAVMEEALTTLAEAEGFEIR